MSEAIKKMLAERKAVADARNEKRKPSNALQKELDEIFATINRAAPFMDEGCDPTKWRPSDKLKLVYFTAATCERPKAYLEALEFIDKMLVKSRGLWIAGLHPDPWCEKPMTRETP